MAAGVKINIYRVNYKNDENIKNSHSVLEFAAPIFLINNETGKYENIRFQNKVDSIKFKPEGYLRPLLAFDPQEEKGNNNNNETITSLSSLEEYLYFNVDPDTLTASLEMELVQRKREEKIKRVKKYKLNIIITKHEFCGDLQLLANNIFSRWYSNISDKYLSYEEKKEESTPIVVKNELDHTITVMKEMVKSGYENRKKNIVTIFNDVDDGDDNNIDDSINTTTLIQKRLLQYDLVIFAFGCQKVISSTIQMFNEISDGEEEVVVVELVGCGYNGKTPLEFILRSSKDFIESKNAIKRGRYEPNFSEKDKFQFLDAVNNILNENMEEVIRSEEIGFNECIKTSNSTIRDLKDPFLPELLKREKLAFLKCFTLTGIPIIAEISRKCQLNPWKLRARLIDHNNNDRFCIFSHSVKDLDSEESLFREKEDEENGEGTKGGGGEEKAEGGEEEKEEDFEMRVGCNYDVKTFNAIVPIFTPGLAKALKPIIQTNIFASLCTYSIFKNPNVVHNDAHFAALMCIWIKLIKLEEISAIIRAKLISILATAKAYMDLPYFNAYKNELIESPRKVLRENDDEEDDDKEVPPPPPPPPSVMFSENLIKPIFYVFYYRCEMLKEKKFEIITLLVSEFIDRLVSTLRRFDNSLNDVFFNLFTSGLELHSMKRRSGNKNLYRKSSLKYFDNSYKKNWYFISIIEGLKDYFNYNKIDDLRYSITLNEDIIYNLVNETYIGDFSLSDFKKIVIEHFDFSESDVNEIFETKRLFACVYYSLTKDQEIRELMGLQNNSSAYEYAYRRVESKIEEDIMKLSYTEKPTTPTRTTITFNG